MKQAIIMRQMYRTLYREFRQKLKQARLDAGLTQTEVARRLGQPQSYVAKCESGARRVDVFELEEFARVYKQPARSLLPKVPQPKRPRKKAAPSD